MKREIATSFGSTLMCFHWSLLPIFNVFLLIFSAETQITPVDLNCTQGAGNATKWAINSDSCSNNYSLEACQAIYSDYSNQSMISTGGNVARPFKCYSLDGGNTYNEEVKLIAVATCAKFCGYCCLTANYSCKNPSAPKTNCSTLTQANCTNAQQKDTLAKDCPATCGLCLHIPPAPCVDTNANCISWTKNGFCYNSFYTLAQRKSYCAKSCNLC